MIDIETLTIEEKKKLRNKLNYNLLDKEKHNERIRNYRNNKKTI